MFPSLLFLAFRCLLHVLCIRTYVTQFISLYFVPLSGLLITSILSLKCNYGHHVMFSMEIHLVPYRRLGGILRLGSASIDGKQKHALKKWMAGFLMFLITTRRILTSVLSRNALITGHIRQLCAISAAKRCMMESLKLSPKWK